MEKEYEAKIGRSLARKERFPRRSRKLKPCQKRTERGQDGA